MKKHVSAASFSKALQQLGVPGGRRAKFLQKHFSSPGKTSTASLLAEAAKYQDWRPLNLQYGRLANQIAVAMGVEPIGLGLLVEFNQPESLTNEHWLLTMRPEFANALIEAGWVK